MAYTLVYVIIFLYLCSIFMWRRYIVYGLMALLIVACTPAKIDRALHVVAQADSLWLSGSAYEDSASLAQAYVDLGSQSGSYPDAYVHACYHYGRLLRTKDDPVGAMQAFINATHTSSHDFHILGRVYSNMGDIAHLADDFPLAYSLYDKSGKMYLQNGDTLLYYYDLNNMAFELAEQGKKEEVLALLKRIETESRDNNLALKVFETKAETYRLSEQFDSAIYYLNQIQLYGVVTPTYRIIKAQSFYRLAQYDSAALYAYQVLSDSLASYQNKFNALYVISHVDSTLSKEDMRDLNSQREDIRYYEYEPEKEKLILAVNLLRQNRDKKSDYRWVLAVIGTLVVSGSFLGLYIYRKHKKHKLLTQHINDLEHRKTETLAQMRDQVETRCSLLKESTHLTKDLCWKDFEQTCIIIDQQFYLLASKLRNKQILNQTEIRLCILVLIGLNERAISEILPYAENSVGKLKYRVSQKLGISAKNLRKYIVGLAIDESLE